jgi:hypothetical protein
VQSILRQDPFSGTIFVFRSKRADRVKLTWASPCKGSRFQQFMLQLRWMYQSPGLSPDLDLVVSQPVPNSHTVAVFATAAPKSRFRRAGAQGDAAILFVGV